jgi:hypothetical protein
MTIDTATPETPPAAARPGRLCDNCGRELLGEHCYYCGQPTKGLVREFSTILGDLADTVFQIDSRILRTLGPLFAKPGVLTLEYFAGHRVRFVSPVRLFVFMSLIAFLLAQWSLDINVGDGGIRVGQGEDKTRDSLTQAKTVADVQKVRAEAIKKLDEAVKESAGVPGVATGLNVAKAQVERAADKRVKEIESGKAAEPGFGDSPDEVQFNDKPWDAKTNPVDVAWLPAFANSGINRYIARAKGNLKRANADPGLMLDAFLSAVPQTLFVLLPLFAVLLKIAYVFKRRLYMEHLIVALHSHAFLCLALALMSVLSILGDWVSPSGTGFVASALGWIEVGLGWWMPLYLLIMQKRVYRQGWLMTLLKFSVLGMAYLFLLIFGAVAALLVSLNGL